MTKSELILRCRSILNTTYFDSNSVANGSDRLAALLMEISDKEFPDDTIDGEPVTPQPED